MHVFVTLLNMCVCEAVSTVDGKEFKVSPPKAVSAPFAQKYSNFTILGWKGYLPLCFLTNLGVSKRRSRIGVICARSSKDAKGPEASLTAD